MGVLQSVFELGNKQGSNAHLDCTSVSYLQFQALYEPLFTTFAYSTTFKVCAHVTGFSESLRREMRNLIGRNGNCEQFWDSLVEVGELDVFKNTLLVWDNWRNTLSLSEDIRPFLSFSLAFAHWLRATYERVVTHFDEWSRDVKKLESEFVTELDWLENRGYQAELYATYDTWRVIVQDAVSGEIRFAHSGKGHEELVSLLRGWHHELSEEL